MLLEIKDLWVHFGRAEAVRGISMEVEEGCDRYAHRRKRCGEDDDAAHHIRPQKTHFRGNTVSRPPNRFPGSP